MREFDLEVTEVVGYIDMNATGDMSDDELESKCKRFSSQVLRQATTDYQALRKLQSLGII
jgi:hypothetical protein